MSNNFNGHEILKKHNHNIDFDIYPVESRWEIAKDAVDYPVHVVQAYYKLNDDFVEAGGETNTGREKNYHLVVVDKYNDGNFNAIATVTGLYGTFETAVAYEELEDQLNDAGVDHSIEHLFVTGNGGAQSLVLELKGFADTAGVPDQLAMRVRMDTSVDGTKAHSLTTLIHNVEGNFDTRLHDGGSKEFNLSARHTNTINERTVDFVEKLRDLATKWNEIIVPTLALIYDEKYDREMVMTVLDEIAKEAEFGERHREALSMLYKSDAVRTKDGSHSLYRIQAVLNQYIEDEIPDTKKELQDRLSQGVAKSLNKRVKKIKSKQ